MFASIWILFFHEYPRRCETFLTGQIIRAAAVIALCRLEDCLNLGNLIAQRDQGPAIDYVEIMLRVFQQDVFEDIVIATGMTTYFCDFIRFSFVEVGIGFSLLGRARN